MPKKNIVLIGFMGSGKTTVGVDVSKKLSCNFVDTDQLIVRQSGKSINDLFAISESYFRSWEEQVCKGLISKSNLIISTGGGVVTHEPSIFALKKLGYIIYLAANDETIYKRVKHHTHRPLLNTKNPLAAVKELYAQRRSFYEYYADFTVNVDNLSIDEISDTILSKYDFFNH